MAITASQRRKAAEAFDRVEASISILRHKLAVRALAMDKLEDIEEQLEITKTDLEEAASAIRSAIWRTRTHPKQERPKRQRHLASCLFHGGRWFCAGDCPHHVIVDVDADSDAPCACHDPVNIQNGLKCLKHTEVRR